MSTYTPNFDDDLHSLREKLTVLDSEIAALEQRLSGLGDRRDRVTTAIAALDSEGDTDIDRPRISEHRGKYRPLWAWLAEQNTDRLGTTFSEIEGILGFGLPPSSRRHLAHWYGYGGSAVARAIYDAGYKASLVDLDAETLEFIRR